VSASTVIVNSVHTECNARLIAADFPTFLGGRMTVTPRDLATSAVPSLEQSSTTMISASGSD
jgi:hypothetical protein